MIAASSAPAPSANVTLPAQSIFVRRVVAISTSLAEGEDGTPAVVALMLDVTDRKRAEDELRKQKEIFQILRRLIRFMPRLPAQAAYNLYNFLIGFVMFNVRSPNETSQELVGATLSVLWLVVPSVHGLFLKDLKQILRKEQCDANLLITANVPSAKKIIVYGPDVGGIPFMNMVMTYDHIRLHSSITTTLTI